MRKSYVLRAFRRRLLANISMIIFLFLAASFLSFLGFKYNSKHQALINILGSQRYVMQQISRDSYKVYTYLDNIDDINHTPSRFNVEDLKTAQQQLANTKLAFEKNIDSLNNGVIISDKFTLNFKDSLKNSEPPIKEINALWKNLSPSIDVIVNARTLSQDVVDASVTIDNSTSRFIDNMNIINNKIIDNNEDKANRFLITIAVLAAIALLGIFFLWTSLYRDILHPIDAIFTNISNIGIYDNSHDNLDNSKDNSLKPLAHEVNDVFDRLNGLIELIENINNNSSFDDILKYIYYSFTPFIPFTYIGIALIEDGSENIRAAYGISDESLNGPSPASKLLGYKTPLSSTSLLNVIKSGKPRIINDLEKYSLNRPFKDYNKIILDAGIRSSITLPIKYEHEAVGVIFFSSKHKNSYTRAHAQFLETIANSIAIAFSKNIFIKDLVLSSIVALAKLAESRDEDTGEHLYRMKKYSRTIAELLYKESSYHSMINPEFIDDVEKFSPLHDIGKVGVADKILLKPGKLTPEEFEEMKLHAVYGANALKAADKNISKDGRSLSVFEVGIQIAEGHHEKWDGSGYPKGKKGKEIPLSARIVAVADVFDALTSKRPYKEPFPVEKCFELINEGSGKHFDPEIVRVFNNNKSIILDLYNEFKANGQL